MAVSILAPVAHARALMQLYLSSSAGTSKDESAAAGEADSSAVVLRNQENALSVMGDSAAGQSLLFLVSSILQRTDCF